MRLDQIRPLKERAGGITHIEDLAIDELISALRNFEEYEISEKIDGSNLQFGYDGDGFYTSRESKAGDERMRSVDDYPIQYSTTFQRSAHLALEKVMPLIIRSEFFTTGDAVEVEVLFGKLPNAVPYNDDANRIIFLRPISGNPDIEGLSDLLEGQRIRVEVDAPFSLNGKTMDIRPERHVWEFAQTPTVNGNEVVKGEAKQELESKLDEIETFLKQPSGIGGFSNAEAISLPLNKRPEGISTSEWKEAKEAIKSLRKKFYDVSDDGTPTGFKQDIKEFLLKRLVRTIGSAFGPEVSDGGWIEGVVFRHKDTNQMFKVVDKDMFTAVKKFIWKVRDELSEKPKSVNTISSFMGKVLVGLGTSLGIPELGTFQAKRALKKHGSTREEILSNLSKEIDFDNTKSYWEKFITDQQEKFNKELDKYIKGRKDLSFTANDRTFKYDDEVHARTLQVFESVNRILKGFLENTRKAKSAEDLIMLLVGRQLQDI
jgi:hypothetical protein